MDIVFDINKKPPTAEDIQAERFRLEEKIAIENRSIKQLKLIVIIVSILIVMGVSFYIYFTFGAVAAFDIAVTAVAAISGPVVFAVAVAGPVAVSGAVVECFLGKKQRVLDNLDSDLTSLDKADKSSCLEIKQWLELEDETLPAYWTSVANERMAVNKDVQIMREWISKAEQVKSKESKEQELEDACRYVYNQI